MYRFKTELNIDFLNREKASKKLGIHRNTLGLIIRGALPCSKQLAYYISQLLYNGSRLEDFFELVPKEKKNCDDEVGDEQQPK